MIASVKSFSKKVSIIFIAIVMVATLIPQITFANEVESSNLITGFAPLEDTEYSYEGSPTESELTSQLPDTIDVYLGGSSYTTSISVSWNISEDYENSDYYIYSAKPSWSESYELDTEIDPIAGIPTIFLFKLESDNDMIEPIVDEDDMEMIYEGEEDALPAEPLDEDADEDDSAAPSESTDVTDQETDTTEDTTVTESEPADTETTEDTLTDNAISLFTKATGTEECYAGMSTNTQKAYTYLKENLGLNRAAACGVLANLYAESGINPINVENTYERKYGFTDSSYTQKVDDSVKKGADGVYYINGSKRSFRTDYFGYGICQWTSLGRRSNLLDRVKARKVSVGNMNVQLDFMAEELKNSYPMVWATLKNVPDNSTGCYLAARLFCLAFEIPANKVEVSANRGKFAVTEYWNYYAGRSDSVSSGTSKTGICGYSYPANIKQGKGMDVSGYVISNNTISKVKGTITNTSTGKVVYSSTKYPGSSVYSLGNIDADMKFSKLSTGSYSYTVYAKDANGKEVGKTHNFKVSSNSLDKRRGVTTTNNTAATVKPPATSTTTATGASTLSISGATYPTRLFKGSMFTVKGKVSSNYAISSVTLSIIDKSTGKVVMSKNAKPNTKTYDLYKFDDDLKFGTLGVGTYSYKVTAKDSKKNLTLLNKTFDVKYPSTLKIVDATYPTSFKKGTSHQYKGVVKSNYYLKKVKIKVTTTGGTTKYSTYVTLEGKKLKSYDIYKLSDKISFSKLPKGTYYYKVISYDSVVSRTVLKKKFTVK